MLESELYQNLPRFYSSLETLILWFHFHFYKIVLPK